MAALHQSAFQRCNQKTSARRQPAVTPPTQKGPDPHRTAAENRLPSQSINRAKGKKRKRNVYRLLCLLFLWQLLLGSLALSTPLLSGGVSSRDELLQVLGSLFSLFLPGFNFAEFLDEVFFFCHLQTRARQDSQRAEEAWQGKGAIYR